MIALKLLFAQKAEVYCPHDGAHVANFTPAKIWEDFRNRINAEGLLEAKAAVAFERRVPHSMPLEEALAALSAQGFTHPRTKRNPRRGNAYRCRRSLPPEHCRTSAGHGSALKPLWRRERAKSFWVEKEGIWTPVGRWRRGRICPECGENSMLPVLRISVSIPRRGLSRLPRIRPSDHHRPESRHPRPYQELTRRRRQAFFSTPTFRECKGRDAQRLPAKQHTAHSSLRRFV